MSNGVRTPQKAAACDGSYITTIRVVKKTKEIEPHLSVSDKLRDEELSCH